MLLAQSDYNWIDSATELVRVCNEPSFSEMYANAIKIIILNCFANLELQQEEDDEQYRELLRKFWASIDLKDL